MTTPEGPYYAETGDPCLYVGPDNFRVWEDDPHLVLARLNQQHAEIERLREENRVLKDWRDTLERCRKLDWCQEHGECCLQDGPRPLCVGNITLLASRDMAHDEEDGEAAQ